MQAIPLVRSGSLLPLHRFLESGGSDLRALRERAQPMFRGSDVLVPVGYAGELFAQAARSAGLADLGFRLGRETRVETFGGWGEILAGSPTPAAWFERFFRLHPQVNTGFRVWTVVRGDEIWLHLRFCRSLRAGRSQAIELGLGIHLAALRALLGPSWRPAEIHLEGEPPSHAEAIAALATRGARFGRPEMAIGFPRRLLARRSAGRPAADPPASMPGPAPARDFAGSVRQTVGSLLRLGAPDLAVAAEVAGMSQRSFQRHLAESGLRFSDLVEQARFEAACHLLADPQRRVIDVSTELGYGDAANFTRAFRRWAGVPPQIYRRANAPHGLLTTTG